MPAGFEAEGRERRPQMMAQRQSRPATNSRGRGHRPQGSGGARGGFSRGFNRSHSGARAGGGHRPGNR